MKPATKPYKESLLEDLKDPKEALGYLRATLEDPDPKVFLLALRDVAEAHGNFSNLSKRAKISRKHLYRILSHEGNPALDTLQALLRAFGFKLAIEPIGPMKRAA